MTREGGRRGGPPPDTTRMVSLKVDGLSHRCRGIWLDLSTSRIGFVLTPSTTRTTSEDLETLFSKFGRLGDCYIPRCDYVTFRDVTYRDVT